MLGSATWFENCELCHWYLVRHELDSKCAVVVDFDRWHVH